jgi:hypothetical protein
MQTETMTRKIGPTTLNLLDFGDITPKSAEDDACFAEIRDVLARHGKLERFGLTLLHKHFEVYDDESLVEYSDPMTRTLTLKVVKDADLVNETVVETGWRLDLSHQIAACGAKCVATTKCIPDKSAPGDHRGSITHTRQ